MLNDLAASAKTKHQVESRLLLDIVVAKSATVFKLLAGKDQALLIRRNAFLILDLLLDVIDRVRWFDIQRDRLAGKSLDENLHTTTQTKHQMECGLLLDVVVAQGTTVFKLLAGKDQALLIRRNSFLILDLLLDVVDRVGWFDI
ncbi:hypothetical protein AC1031_022120 [Aphanomyces cochlioides]|nr:hypothetical protein AC1031_022120 [Aphanomyces cochlioides]